MPRRQRKSPYRYIRHNQNSALDRLTNADYFRRLSERPDCSKEWILGYTSRFDRR
jgi:hypothetical protein